MLLRNGVLYISYNIINYTVSIVIKRDVNKKKNIKIKTGVIFLEHVTVYT